MWKINRPEYHHRKYNQFLLLLLLLQMSRASSPENDFVDVESTDNRPHSSASGTSQKQSISGACVPSGSKRSRGRPRKFKENSEEGLWIQDI